MLRNEYISNNKKVLNSDQNKYYMLTVEEADMYWRCYSGADYTKDPQNDFM